MANIFSNAFNNLQPANLVNDILTGYKDNYTNSFAPNNWGTGSNLATKIGEGLGTVGKIVDSPLGRGLIAAGLNSAMGYDNSLKEGLTAFAGRQNASTADKIYRNSLNGIGIDTGNLNGDITSDVFKNIIAQQRLYNNKMTYGDLAMFDENVAEGIKLGTIDPNAYIPTSYGNNIYKNQRGLNQSVIDKNNAWTATDEATRQGKVDVLGARAKELNARISQNQQRINLLSQKVAQGWANAKDRAELNQLKAEQYKRNIEKTELQNQLLQNKINNGDGNNKNNGINNDPLGIR